MTTSRGLLRSGLAAVLVALATTAIATPTAWTWSYAELAVDPTSPADSPWRSSLPQLLVKSWDHLPTHMLSEGEAMALGASELEARRHDLERQRDQKALEVSRLRLQPVLPAGEPGASEKALATLEKQLVDLGSETPAGLPKALPFQLVLPSARPELPSTATAPTALEQESRAFYLVTGTLKIVAGYLNVTIALTSTLERRTLAKWAAAFAPEEAPEQMALAARALQEALLGRPWSAVDIRDELSGTVVELEGEGRRTLPWRGEFLAPGAHLLTIFRPGIEPEVRQLTLLPNQTFRLALTGEVAARQMLSLTSDPPGATVTADSRILGKTPVDLPRPLALTRVKFTLDGFAPQVLELSAGATEGRHVVLLPPQPAPDTVASRDKFYLTTAALTGSLALTVFLRDAADQTYRLATAYSSGTNLANFNSAVGQYQFYWYASQAGLALTTGVFVWMMFTLGDFLAAAQTPLP